MWSDVSFHHPSMLNCIVLIVEVLINHTKYAKSLRRFESLRVFINHAPEQYDAMIAFIQIVDTLHIDIATLSGF